jgi:hypothetical protein
MIALQSKGSQLQTRNPAFGTGFQRGNVSIAQAQAPLPGSETQPLRQQ